jgi:hypothetical protein
MEWVVVVALLPARHFVLIPSAVDHDNGESSSTAEGIKERNI